MNGETILCVSTRRWDSLWRSTQHIISRIAAQNRVVYIEPGRNPDKSVFVEFGRNIPNYFKLQMKQVQKNLTVIPSPSSVPQGRRHLPLAVLRPWIPIQTSINTQILSAQIRRIIDTLKIQEPILWLYDPAHYGLVGKFGEKLSCYYVYDEGAEFAPNVRIKDVLETIENQMVMRVNVIFASSSIQAERRKNINPNTYFIPNAAEFALFSQALTGNLPIPGDIASLPHPIIGFAGWMGYQIDVALLRLVAESFPNCSLVLIGPDQLPESVDSQRLHSLPNVFFLGQKKMSDLPSYLQVFDVALMPWLLTGHMRYAYPLKLHEYLAAGRAPVATPLPELRSFSHVVRIAETHKDFIKLVREALTDYSQEAIDARVAVARENTWDNRVAEIYKHFEYHLKEG